jgi:dihydroorotase
LDAVKQALKDGTIDAIASDHAPHTESEKDLEFDKASFGIIGLETSLALSLRLVSEKVISMKQLIEAMSCKPANVLKLNRGTLSLGASADITIFDPDLEWKFTKETIESKSCNSPFLNWDLKGQATDVIVGGQIVLQNGRIRN